MPLNLSLTATISEEGQLVYDEPTRLTGWLAMGKGQKVHIELERGSKRRTNAQNARWWTMLIPFCQEVLSQKTGMPMDKDTAHDIMARAFLGTTEVMIGGEVIAVRKPTRTLSTADFAELMRKTELWIWEEFKVDPALIQNPEALP